MSLFAPHANQAKFDWYRTSLRLQPGQWDGQLADVFMDVMRPASVAECTPNKPFERGTGLFTASRSKLLKISRGGDHVKGVTQLESTGVNAPLLYEALMRSGVQHEPTRVDAAIDWVEEGLFDTLAPLFKQFAQDKGLSISTPGDWVRGQGRTLYIGSRSSAVMVRLYEKGYEQRKKGDDAAPLDWVRFEVEVKFKKAQQKRAIAGFQPFQFFQIGWVSELCDWLMFSPASIPIPTTYRAPDFDRALAHLRKQYAATLQRLADQCEDSQQFMDVLLGRVA